MIRIYRHKGTCKPWIRWENGDERMSDGRQIWHIKSFNYNTWEWECWIERNFNADEYMEDYELEEMYEDICSLYPGLLDGRVLSKQLLFEANKKAASLTPL